MDLKDQLKLIADRTKHKDSIQTEEATKNAFVMPFLQSLGYDVFNPLEVVPEFVADIGIKKGEKIMVWNNSSVSFKTFMDDLLNSGLQPLHLTVNKDKNHILTFCQNQLVVR